MGFWEKTTKRFSVIHDEMLGMEKDMEEEMNKAFDPIEIPPEGIIEKETTVTEKKPDGTIVTTKTVIRTRKK
jgi:hypothetical protein